MPSQPRQSPAKGAPTSTHGAHASPSRREAAPNTTSLIGRGLLGREEAVGERDLDLAVKVRDALRSAASSNSSPARGRADVTGVCFDELPLVLRIREALKPELASCEGGVKGALGRILADVAVASSKGTWARMKICAAEDCRWAYYDHSKSRTGRWCAMETCGDRHKTRRYRRKRRDSARRGE